MIINHDLDLLYGKVHALEWGKLLKCHLKEEKKNLQEMGKWIEDI